MSKDNKLRCTVIYRLDGDGPTAVPLCKLDYAASIETHKKDGGTSEELYGAKKADFAKAVARVISNDPPTGISKGTKCGGFKVVQADVHQVVYGADTNNICKSVTDMTVTPFVSAVPFYYVSYNSTLSISLSLSLPHPSLSLSFS